MLAIVIGYRSSEFSAEQIKKFLEDESLPEKNVFVSVADNVTDAVNLAIEAGWDKVYILSYENIKELEVNDFFVTSPQFIKVCHGGIPFSFYISSGSEGDGWDGIEHGISMAMFCTQGAIGKKEKEDYIRVFLAQKNRYFHHLGDSDFVPDDVIGCIWKGEDQIRFSVSNRDIDFESPDLYDDEDEDEEGEEE